MILKTFFQGDNGYPGLPGRPGDNGEPVSKQNS